MQDAWRAYLELALGMTEASRKQAQTVVRRLVEQSGATAGQLQALAEELVNTGMTNRNALTRMIRVEVDRALAAVGLATADEVAELAVRVAELEREVQAVRAGTTAAGAAGPATVTSGATVQPVPTATSTTGVRRTAADKAVAKATAKDVAPKPSAPGVPVAKRAVAKKAMVKKAVAKKLPPAES